MNPFSGYLYPLNYSGLQWRVKSIVIASPWYDPVGTGRHRTAVSRGGPGLWSEGMHVNQTAQYALRVMMQLAARPAKGTGHKVGQVLERTCEIRRR